jgi:ParB family chromosome partitioning protein
MDNKEIIKIDVEKIIPNRYQPREVFNMESLIELKDSIDSYGIIQPISVRKLEDEKFEIIAGERRFKAAKMAGLTKIPSIVVEIEENDSANIALIENIQREDLNFIEEAKAYSQIMEKFGLTQEDLAGKIGKKQSTIANKLRILKLPESIKDKLIANDLTERHGRALLKIKDEEVLEEVLYKIIEKNLNVKDTEKLIDSLKEKLKEDTKSSKQSIRNFINYKIYINTIKNAYNEILKTGIKAKFEEKEKDDYIEVRVKIPKNNL